MLGDSGKWRFISIGFFFAVRGKIKCTPSALEMLSQHSNAVNVCVWNFHCILYSSWLSYCSGGVFAVYLNLLYVFNYLKFTFSTIFCVLYKLFVRALLTFSVLYFVLSSFKTMLTFCTFPYNTNLFIPCSFCIEFPIFFFFQLVEFVIRFGCFCYRFLFSLYSTKIPEMKRNIIMMVIYGFAVFS